MTSATGKRIWRQQCAQWYEQKFKCNSNAATGDQKGKHTAMDADAEQPKALKG
jgi:hypothetical protein